MRHESQSSLAGSTRQRLPVCNVLRGRRALPTHDQQVGGSALERIPEGLGLYPLVHGYPDPAEASEEQTEEEDYGRRLVGPSRRMRGRVLLVVTPGHGDVGRVQYALEERDRWRHSELGHRPSWEQEPGHQTLLNESDHGDL
jgi:hypothetical protein